MNALLRHYVVDVEHPDVSGFEHLEMLQIRSQLAELEATLYPRERACLDAADCRLLQQAAAFHAALARITNLAEERARRQPPPSHWWWYLDVLVQLPTPPVQPAEMEPVLV
ncbi:MAG TPA: hypothetical protein EYP49_00670 [Anaerolineae bacterium]|nr:hypothetical protein [Anaerolineae bacterium]